MKKILLIILSFFLIAFNLIAQNQYPTYGNAYINAGRLGLNIGTDYRRFISDEKVHVNGRIYSKEYMFGNSYFDYSLGVNSLNEFTLKRFFRSGPNVGEIEELRLKSDGTFRFGPENRYFSKSNNHSYDNYKYYFLDDRWNNSSRYLATLIGRQVKELDGRINLLGLQSFVIYNNSSNYANISNVYGIASNVDVPSTISEVVAIYGSVESSNHYAGFFQGKVGHTGGIYKASDKRLKKNIKPSEKSLDLLLKLTPKDYEYKKEISNSFPDGIEHGLLAQEVEAIFPELVTSNFKLNLGDDENYLAVNYTGLIPIIIKAIQEQQEIINNQAEEISKLYNVISLLNSSKEDELSKTGYEKTTYFYPNPAGSYVTFNYNEKSSENTQIKIFDSTMKQLKEIAVTSYQQRLNVSELSQGVYFFMISENGKVIKIEKILIK